MRTIHTTDITAAVKGLCIEANCNLNKDIENALCLAARQEKSQIGKEILSSLCDNAAIARSEAMPICQDTGMMIILAQVGQEAYISGGGLTEAINEGVRQGYKDGYLRCSVVGDPLRRKNTGDNTPAVIYYDIVEGSNIRITAMPKGFGSENMSAVKMLKPSDGVSGVIDFVLNTVNAAGSNPCPPIVVGVGIGGTMDKAALLSKKALARSIDTSNPDEYYADLEKQLLEKINRLGIGPQGLGGSVTALGLNIEVFPTHIAGLPVAVTISCHVTRHAEVVL